MDDFIYFICYPGGNKEKITVARLSRACDYEISDYALASRNRWYEPKEAEDYCKELAEKNDLTYVRANFSGDDNDHLD